MPRKKPHISLPPKEVVSRVLCLGSDQFSSWPESVQELAVSLAAELFIIRYNPFIDTDLVIKSVLSRLDSERSALSPEYYQQIRECLDNYIQRFKEDREFTNQVLRELKKTIPEKNFSADPHILVACSTDATDLRMELPMLILFPETTLQIQEIVRLANELKFSLIPRGGGSGLTGGAVPGRGRCAILSLSRMKEIISIDKEEMVLCCQTGTITLDAIKAVENQGLLFTVDPASKSASSVGGNVSENAGGPFAFEYGTTIDNVLSYKMVRPDASLIEVRRKNHPRHKILPRESPVFEVLDSEGNLLETITLSGEEIRSAGLGKDVTNKYLGGLPGIQKEGVDGVITDVCFTLHPRMSMSRVLCLEFFGASMRNAMYVIRDIVGLRDKIRKEGDLVKISALEEFGSKYVQAIEYRKKSEQYEGEPISVLIVQLDSNNSEALNQAVQNIVDIATPYDQVDIFVARDEKEAELFWEDRHKLSAIAKRTSGFKINEDVVIPLKVIPEFSDFIEELNLYYLARAYRSALNEVLELEDVDVGDEFIDMEMGVTKSILQEEVSREEISEQELELQTEFFFLDLKYRYPDLDEELSAILEKMRKTRIIVANHMHAGDGNCHVNLPVNSNDPEMMHQAEEAAEKVFARVLQLGGQITGEHGIGITKINYLDEAKIKALKTYKDKVDPENVFNPTKLTQKKLPVTSYTFSFNQLIEDIRRTGIKDKERLTELLRDIQTCTRCGKCKQVCPMFIPKEGFLFHPRNKNLVLGALIEAIYYSQLIFGEPDMKLLDTLRDYMEHCTACGKCKQVCPVKIDNAGVALRMRAFLDERNAGGHPVKTKVLDYLSRNPRKTVPKAARAAGAGQMVQNQITRFVPASWRARIDNPLWRSPGPQTGVRNLYDALPSNGRNILVPEKDTQRTVLYFPGCGGSLFFRDIGLATLYLLLRTETCVILPPVHMCCGYPLLSAGAMHAFRRIQKENKNTLQHLINSAWEEGFRPDTVLTACGTCREGIANYDLQTSPGKLQHMDVLQYLLPRLPEMRDYDARPLVYHAACHSEWAGVNPAASGEIYAAKLEDRLGTKIQLSPGCCGESGLGALSSPEIYNVIRKRKKERLHSEMAAYPEDRPILVGCPSCKIGIKRSLIQLKDRHNVMHSVEFLANLIGGKSWKKDLARMLNGKK
jgi:FAD/FMN-containing dehydrogenase/Fe-S oxidoreductase